MHSARTTRAGVTRYCRQAWWLALALAVVLVTGLFQVGRVLPALGISPEIVPTSVGYVHAMAWGMPALLAFLSLRYTSEGLGRTKPIMYFGFLGLAANVFGNWVFMYGKFGMPQLGAVGCGVATAISEWLMFLAMLAYMRRQRVYRPFDFFARIDRPDPRVLRELARIGLPIAGSVLAEGGLVRVRGADDRRHGRDADRGSPDRAELRVLHVHGAARDQFGDHDSRRPHDRSRRARARTFGGAARHRACARASWRCPRSASCCSTTASRVSTRGDPAVRQVAAGLLLMAAIFQLSDGVQVGAAGALRGFKDTAIPMAMCIFSYWVVGFPLAYVFGVQQRRRAALRVDRLHRGPHGQRRAARQPLFVSCRGGRCRRGRRWSRRGVIAVAERLDVFDQAVDEAHLAHQLVGTEIVGPDFHRYFD